MTTPVQNVRLYTNESGSTNEIEEQLPQMMKFFEADPKPKKFTSNVIQYKLDLSGGFLHGKTKARTRMGK